MRIVVLAKSPQPGRSKTRLQSRWSPEQAAALAAAALADTLATVAEVAEVSHVLVLDGAAIHDLPAGFDVRPQVAGDLAHRIHAALAFDDVPALLIGMDTPHVTVADLEQGVRGLLTHDAALGLADDGGWWALGLAHPQRDAHLVLGIPTSTAHTGSLQAARLRAAGLEVQMLRTLRDVDLPADADHVAGLAPNSRFGALVRELASA